ncbi:GNAT family N-acetyltransferase [Actinoplanes aureus]|uniref:GNAT family N-acetyltransferase n=1 Tax=Actinoplanes aureus TaxID=2792083 RepID=A0A931CDI5_9ACTN|nr:GNAT family N-acetyltransferase [Actinoplanes aureus]MBG0564168.1 GNAT family N-acetyltransferase [Actinoplanes aureus]
MPTQIRPFLRSDREQVTSLVNAHVAAVVPGVSLSVQALLSQLEREPGEFIVDRWVRDRVTLVAEQRGRVVAAAHLLRYADDENTGAEYRNAGEIRWLLCWPDAPYWPDAAEAGQALAVACHAQLTRWGVTRRYADGALPVPGVYGVPEQWPHVRAIYESIGFRAGGRTEIVLVADVGRLRRPAAPVPGLVTRRTLGINGTRLTASLSSQDVGFIEVDTNLDSGPRVSRVGAWADIGNLWIAPDHRGRGIGAWLVGQAAGWLDLGGATRLLSYADEDEKDFMAFHLAAGFTVLTRTTRQFVSDHGPDAASRPPTRPDR